MVLRVLETSDAERPSPETEELEAALDRPAIGA